MGLALDWKMRKVIEHEGYRIEPYTDSKGYITGGIGHKFTKKDFETFDNRWPRSKKEEYWRKCFEEDYARAEQAALAMIERYKIIKTENILCVLIDMAFNLGHIGLSKFDNFLQDLAKGDIEGAIREMKYVNKTSDELSPWYKQVPNRVNDLISILRSSE